MNSHTLTLRLFGAFDAAVNGKPIARPFHSDRLLALLALRSAAPLERAWIAATLWPEAEEANARFYLRRTLAALRQALGEAAGRLHAPTAQTLQIDLAGADCDLATFDRAVAHADPIAIEKAIVLYRGRLLEGWYDEWTLLPRQTYEQKYLDALESLACAALARHAPEQAIAPLRSLLAIEPLRERALRLLMEALAGAGDHAAVTQTYREFRLRLHQDLRAEPDAQTVALYQTLRARAHATAQPPPRPSARSAAPLLRLPAVTGSLIGREREKAQLLALLSTTRLLTLTGAGGVGKTRLAIAVAQDASAEYAEGACFVDLAPRQEAAQVLQAIAEALGVREEPERVLEETLLSWLQERSLLLILDNCEHLATSCAAVVHRLLGHCPHLRVLATSRQPLGLGGERSWRVPSLSLPAAIDSERPADKGDCSALMESEAVRLFIERSVAAASDFCLTPANAATVAEICRLLDGIPLALELAAAWAGVLPMAKTADRLRRRLDLLQARQPEKLLRHQTMRAVLDWSYELLKPEEQRLLQRFSVFAGGWTLEAAEAVCQEVGDSPDSVLLGMAALVDKSLVIYTEQNEEGRYRLLEITRTYAAEKLSDAGDEGSVRARHYDYYLALSEEAYSKRFGSAGPALMRLLDVEHDNCRAALEFCAASPDAQAHLRLAGALNQFWAARGHFREGRAYLAAALSRPDGAAATAARARALNGDGVLARYQGNYDTAVIQFEQSAEVWRAIGEPRHLGMTLGNLGLVYETQGRYDLARQYMEEGLLLLREADDRAGLAVLLNNYGWLAYLEGDYAQSIALLEECVTLSDEIGNVLILEIAAGNLADLLVKQGDYAAACAL